MDLVFYNGRHWVQFGEYHSWNDWHLIPASKPVIAPPKVKSKMIDIPGTHGSINLTYVLTGWPMYENRTGSLEFILAPGFLSWENTKSMIMDEIQGRSVHVILGDNPEYYYDGLVWVDALKSDAKLNSITINYDLYPFKRSIITSDQDWLWDPFNFETGVIRVWNQLAVNNQLDLVIDDCTEMVYPVITVSSAMGLVFRYHDREGVQHTESYELEAGTSTPGFMLRPGVNMLSISGNGTVTIRYRGGRL